MSHSSSPAGPDHERTGLRMRSVVAAWILGATFVVASVLAPLLPALAVAYLVVGFAVRDVVVVLALWAASATITVVTFLAISRTYAERVLRRRVLETLPFGGPSED